MGFLLSDLKQIRTESSLGKDIINSCCSCIYNNTAVERYFSQKVVGSNPAGCLSFFFFFNPKWVGPA